MRREAHTTIGLTANCSGGLPSSPYPARYGMSGVVSFMINQDGVVYQKDLGQNTAALAAEMTEFDPDANWRRAP